MFGGYYLCVRLTNAKQGRQVFGRTPIITLDRTVPTIEPIPAMTLGAIAKVTPKITENSKTSYAWSKISGPGEVTFGSPTEAETNVGASTPGNYTIQIEATDQALNKATMTVNILWDATIPTFNSLVKTGVAKDGFINFAESKDTKPVYELTASNYASIKYTKPLPVKEIIPCTGNLKYELISIPSSSDFKLDGTFMIMLGDMQPHASKSLRMFI